MQEADAMQFYEKVVQGTKNHKVISLETDEGWVLEGVEMYAVDKQTLAGVIERLPEQMFEAVEEAEGDADEAEENVDGDLSAVTAETVAAFEDLLKESLNHPELTNTQMSQIIRSYSFEVLFRLGTEVINMSVEETGSIKDFHEQE